MKTLVTILLTGLTAYLVYWNIKVIQHGIELHNKTMRQQEDLRSGDCSRMFNVFLEVANDADTYDKSIYTLRDGYTVFFECERKKFHSVMGL